MAYGYDQGQMYLQCGMGAKAKVGALIVQYKLTNDYHIFPVNIDIWNLYLEVFCLPLVEFCQSDMPQWQKSGPAAICCETDLVSLMLQAVWSDAEI